MKAIKPQIVEALKKMGYNQRQVSIKEHGCSYNLTVRDPKVNMENVEVNVKGLQSVSYDERTQEILSGGNTFIFVEASNEVKEIWSKENLEIVEAAFAKLAEEKDGTGIAINENYDLFKTKGPYWYSAYYHSSVYPHASERVSHDTNSAKGVALQMHLHAQRLALKA